ncbi:MULTISPECIES: tyrosine-protein phosphatase [Myroides]|uniref:Protein-tyrosine-phosphatase n=1 Tax=Myroides albus TaxID=2562892 RepID=A0A6I3LMQ3_9FLAO|nr:MULTISPECIES: tyrosine-protein phosphatase [Myroides]MTG97871.1 protein-tyrosine-phosphatase [Myroides albus]MVX34245.1 protein-tyrosine-phosphatase [Myroides sp. LoEW2-1]UVD81058.1 tyrosine-protein phosphatase [Myroides albus]
MLKSSNLLHTSQNPVQLSSSKLTLEGQTNFRDLGGIPNKEGVPIKEGIIFRSGQLNDLTYQDIKLLGELNLTSVIDFRSKQEVSLQPHKLPNCTTNAIHLPITPGKITPSSIEKIVVSGDVEGANEYLLSIYRQLVLENQKEYRLFFEQLINNQGTPTLFNCTAGKDRTGFAAVLFLSALDIERELIYEDYLKTNHSVQTMINQLSAVYQLEHENQKQAFNDMMTVKEAYLNEIFHIIDKEYSSIDHYLTKQLKVDKEKIQSIYLNV